MPFDCGEVSVWNGICQCQCERIPVLGRGKTFQELGGPKFSSRTDSDEMKLEWNIVC